MDVSNEFRPDIKNSACEPILTISTFVMRTKHFLILYPYALSKGIFPWIEGPRMTGKHTFPWFPRVRGHSDPDNHSVSHSAKIVDNFII